VALSVGVGVAVAPGLAQLVSVGAGDDVSSVYAAGDAVVTGDTGTESLGVGVTLELSVLLGVGVTHAGGVVCVDPFPPP